MDRSSGVALVVLAEDGDMGNALVINRRWTLDEEDAAVIGAITQSRLRREGCSSHRGIEQIHGGNLHADRRIGSRFCGARLAESHPTGFVAVFDCPETG